MADCGENSTRVLLALCTDPLPPTTLLFLKNETGISRKALLRALGRLMNNKLARRVGRDLPAMYEATDRGRALIASGRRVTSGPKGPHTGPRKQRKETFRARLWRAFRMKQKATIPDLIEIARDASCTENLSNNAQIYMRRLVSAGVASTFLIRAKGFAPTSNGFKRFALIRDLGPQAPRVHADHLFDPNSGEKIPYQAKRT